MKKKNGAFGAGQFSLGTLAGGRPGTTIFQNPGGGGGGGAGGCRIQGPGPAAPPWGHQTTYLSRTVEHVDKSAKRRFCIISRFHAELSKLWPRTREMRLLPAPLSPMKSPQRKAKVNTRRASAIKLRFEKFLQGLPQADNRNVELTTDGLWAMPLNTGWVQSRHAGCRIGKN